jgi:hypothetical protein
MLERFWDAIHARKGETKVVMRCGGIRIGPQRVLEPLDRIIGLR